MDREKMFGIVGLVLVVGAVIGYSVFNIGKSSSAMNTAPVESVATVNGVAIPKTQYDAQLASVLATLKTQGVDVTDPTKLSQVRQQVLNDFISNELVNQEVIKAGIKANPADVEAQFQALQTQNGGAAGLKTQLAAANLTEAQLRDNIAKQLAVQAYLLKNIDITLATTTDAEITQFYKDYSKAQVAASSTIKVPALKDLKEQIRQQIVTNKQQTLVTTFVSTLRAKANVVITLK